MKILVTGAYGGIGRAICDTYAALGCQLVITGKDQQKLDLLGQQISDNYAISVFPLAADVTDEAAISNLFKSISQSLQGLDVMVHCAGVLTESPLMMTSISVIQKDIAINLTSSIIFCQQASKLMIRKKSGVITLMSSIVANQGSAGQSVYAASKAGITGLVKSLAKELGPVGIRINGLAPGFIETPMMDAYEQSSKDKISNKTCIGRLGTAADIAPLAVFLSSSSAAYITGQIISIDGGLVL